MALARLSRGRHETSEGAGELRANCAQELEHFGFVVGGVSQCAGFCRRIGVWFRR